MMHSFAYQLNKEEQSTYGQFKIMMIFLWLQLQQSLGFY